MTTENQSQQQQFNNEMRGALFVNDKGGNNKRPDYRGRCTINGKDYRISGWKRRAVQSGQWFLSLSFTAETQQPQQTAITQADFDSPTPEEDKPGF